MSEHGRIFNIQRFSTHDGPGIRTTVFFQGCPLRCFWCQNPESQPLGSVLMYNDEACIACGSCAASCPKGLPRLEGDTVSFDRETCLGCGKCADNCPMEGLKISGYEASVDEVHREIMKDYLQYLNSNGGVTLSGGEVMMQPDFAAALLKKCKESGLHTLVETCGFAPWSAFEKVLAYTDEFYWDIKATDSDKHKEATGAGNELILANASKMLAADKAVRFRMPLIPGFNDSDEDVLALRSLVTDKLGAGIDSIDLLRYNSLGEVKFRRIGRQNEIPNMKPQSEERIAYLNQLLCSGKKSE